MQKSQGLVNLFVVDRIPRGKAADKLYLFTYLYYYNKCAALHFRNYTCRSGTQVCSSEKFILGRDVPAGQQKMMLGLATTSFPLRCCCCCCKIAIFAFHPEFASFFFT